MNAYLNSRSPRRLYYNHRLAELLKSSLIYIIHPHLSDDDTEAERESDEGMKGDPSLLSSEGEMFCFSTSLALDPKYKKFNFWKVANNVVLSANIMSHCYGQYDVI